MKKHNEKINEESRRKEIIRRAILIGAAVVVLILIVVIISMFGKSGVTTEEGMNLLRKMEQTEVAEIESRIQEIEKNELEQSEAWLNRTPNEKFANSLVLGDSITQGLSEYHILDEAYVLADRGAGICKQTDGKSSAHIQKAEELKPQVLFLAYGLNDLTIAEDDDAMFYTMYKETIADLRSKLPNTAIYINGILPIKPVALEKSPYYGNVDKYNSRLKQLCEEENITYIDNAELVEDEFYAQDGIHMSVAYYRKWVDHMAEAAGI